MAAYFLSAGLNFLAVFGGMLLFFLPFCGLFAYRHRRQILAVRPHFNYFMERFFGSPEFNALVFVWAAGEALVWYIIPEFLLFLVVFMKVHRKFDLVKYDLFGTIAGTLIGLVWHLPAQAFLRLPFIRPAMMTQVHDWYASAGVWGLAHQPFSGVPYKVFTHEAAGWHFYIPLFIGIAIVARMARYLVAYGATVAIYPLLHRFVRKHYAILFVVASVVFTLLLTRVVQIYS
ncbi:MAG TPA: hypothetical protein VFH39_04595 [Candidatus Saccharimonadales bacterium]|nr:hypothetical protein [Candidatus Saccharimonadales bacterium]